MVTCEPSKLLLTVRVRLPALHNIRRGVIRMVNVFVDDLRKCPDNYLLFRTAEEFIEYLTNNPETKINVLSLDHDLGLEVMDGYELVKNIYYQFPELHIQEVRLHTDNGIGFRNMYHYFVSAMDNNALPNVKYVSPNVYDVIDGEIKQGLKFIN